MRESEGAARVGAGEGGGERGRAVGGAQAHPRGCQVFKVRPATGLCIFLHLGLGTAAGAEVEEAKSWIEPALGFTREFFRGWKGTVARKYTREP